MYEGENWKDMIMRDRKGFIVKGVTEKYSVSSYGRVWNKLENCFVSQVLTGKPQYWYVNLKPLNSKRILRRVHNIMGHTFLEEPECIKITIDHIDRNKYNNSLDNLRWASRKEQSLNRDVSSMLDCGTSLTSWIDSKNLPYPEVRALYDKGYKSPSSLLINLHLKKRYGVGWDSDIEVGSSTYQLGYLLNSFNLDKQTTLTLLQKGLAFNEIVKGHKEVLGPPVEGMELNGFWYPSLQYICDNNVANCSVSVLKERLNSMSLEEAITYDGKIEKYGFEYQGEVDTLSGHCVRLGLSYLRVSAVKTKHGITNEEALKAPVKRVIKHCINGNIKRNSDWYFEFNIPTRTANSYLNRSGIKRTFRDVLEHFNVDTSNMMIFPCDGDVVMKNNPI
ncbi:putative homing endonuclease HNH [Vibrio phage 277E43-1]|nr:putative homing endonuclease HNH [Vibrio phage 277E43-1]